VSIKADPSDRLEKIKCKSKIANDNETHSSSRSRTHCKSLSINDNNEATGPCDRPNFFSPTPSPCVVSICGQWETSIRVHLS
jgi:hypothetical protein